ncbi:protein Shroom2 isoform X3 [Oncorhynchus mykiss]|uniref:protein Shroom2 isoform X3 n=1 Tax=Oncorhynchus mykiss TaxID=8022 RepID=UPI0018779D72|nr:protein Shroom2 isoform X3 [Oncorhynchus mykiss]
MDVVDYRSELRMSAREVKAFLDADRFTGVWDGIQGDVEYRFVDVLLFGGAPWGFTLRGGLEHREPLLITKVEEGSKAATVSLQVGDEIVNINTVPISGSRQEAICLVKSSHKTLALVVRRRNEPVSQPHSWHSSKFTEDHPEPTESHNEPSPVWQVKHEVSASTKDLSSCGDHDSNLRQLSSQFSSVGNMERVERPSHPYPPGCLSPSRYHRSAEPLSGGGVSGGKSESPFSCLSSTSPPPEPALALTNTEATEGSVFYKGVQTQGEQRHSRNLQLPQGDGGSESPRTVPEEQPGSRYSSSGSGRSHIGPVWHVPERRKVAAPPSPPPPPLRNDSFAATKVYPAYTEGPGAPPQAPENSSYRARGNHISHNENGPDPRCSYNPPPHKKDFLHPNIAAGAPDYNHNQLSNPNKLFSLSSQDVRQSQSPFACLPNHQRQYSDESTFYLQTRSAPHPPKPQSVGSYYHSLQELPTNRSNSRNHVRSSTTSLSTSTIDQNYDGGGHIRYYCITTKQPGQPETRVRQSKSEVWMADMELAKGSNDRGSTSSSHKTNKVKYHPQPPYANSKERNGNVKAANVLLYEHTASNSSSGKPTTEERERRSEGQRPTEAQLRSSYSPSPPKDHKAAPLREDPWVSQENNKISSQKTPMLHSLAQGSRSLAQESRSPMLHSLAQESRSPMLHSLAQESRSPILHSLAQESRSPMLHSLAQESRSPMLHSLAQESRSPMLHSLAQESRSPMLHSLAQESRSPMLHSLAQESRSPMLHSLAQESRSPMLHSLAQESRSPMLHSLAQESRSPMLHALAQESRSPMLHALAQESRSPMLHSLAQESRSPMLHSLAQESRSPMLHSLAQESRSPMLHSLAQESRSPMLHSLAQESRILVEKIHSATAPPPPPSNGGGDTNHAIPEALTNNTATGKLARRSDRYATTLRNEIQLKRAQLQKSRSAATLTCPSETEEPEEEADAGGWKSTSSDGSFSSSYKDHLKEAQARVLQATSFRRRDLEPPGSGSEAPLTKPNSHIVSRIGCRKRFPLNKRVHSFSEPDKINKLGVEGEGEHPVGTARPIVDRRKIFEMAAKPAFCRPISTIHKSGQQSTSTTSSTLEHSPGKARGRAHSGETQEKHPDPLSPAGRQALLEQQRLGTFTEYQVTWNMQRKASDAKTQGRYHSADDILDQGTEETPVCVHERSRSSPSQDFYTQKIPVPWRETAEILDHRQDQQGGSYTTRGPSESQEQPAQLHHFPQPPQPSIPRLTDTEPHSSRDVATPAPLPLPHPSDHRYKCDSADPGHNLPAYPSNHTHSSVSEQPLPPPTVAPKPQNTGLIIMPQWPLLGLETPSATSSTYGLSSQEFLPGPCTHQAEPSSSSSCSSHGTELDPAPNQACSLGSTQLPSPSPGRTAGLGTEEGAADSTLEPPPSSSHSPLFSYQTASLTVPSSGGTSSPSPQFAPQRLTDQPPVSVSVQDEAQSRPENRTNAVMEMSSVGKKVPVKIVHAESTTERESRQYLLHSERNGAPGVSEGPDFPPPLPTSLPSPEPQPYSLFRAYTPYTRHGPQSPPRDPTLTVAPEEALSPGRSQTNGPSGTAVMGPQQPQKSNSEEDVKREELARDIMDKDKSLVDILDQSKMKTTMDLMGGIFPQGEQILDGGHQRRKVSPKQCLPPRGMDERREEGGMSAATGALVTSSTYYSTSAPKAELLNKMKDMQEEELEEDSEDELDIDLASKKQELIDSLGKKLQVLREARENLQEDLHDNNSLGDEVEAVVQRVCKPNELDKFRMFVGDLDKVVSLLLSLSGRLARVENALNSLEEDTTPEEKRTLSEKRKLLIRQHEDAKELKENLDRRERLVYSIMAAHLSHESLADYQHFVKMKSALIIEQRKLDDKIKLGEEQLKCLLDSLLLEQRLLF